MKTLTLETACKKVTSLAKGKALAICPITGIAQELSIPAIPEVYFPFIHPFANALIVAKAIKVPNYMEQLPPCILAGCLLTVYRDLNLLGKSSLSISEQNILLQQIIPTKQREILEFFAQFLESAELKETMDFPAIAIEEKDDLERQKSSISSLVMQHYLDCKATREIELEEMEEIKEADRIYRERKAFELAQSKAKNSSKSKSKLLLQEGKRLFKELTKMGILSPALIALLKGILIDEETLILTEESVKTRIFLALIKRSTKEGNRLAEIVSSPCFKESNGGLFDDFELFDSLDSEPALNNSEPELNESVELVEDLSSELNNSEPEDEELDSEDLNSKIDEVEVDEVS